jgi:hypothetical protein
LWGGALIETWGLCDEMWAEGWVKGDCVAEINSTAGPLYEGLCARWEYPVDIHQVLGRVPNQYLTLSHLIPPPLSLLS